MQLSWTMDLDYLCSGVVWGMISRTFNQFVTAWDGICNIHAVKPSATRSSLLVFIQDRGQNGVDLEVSLANLSFKHGVFGKEIFILLRMPSKMIYDVKLGLCDS